MGRKSLTLASGIAMIAGVAMYAFLRPEYLRAGVWLGELWPPARMWSWERSWAALCVGSLPGGLWMFSSTALQVAIWADRPGRARQMWMLAPPALGVGWELAQGMGVLSGTYDPLDLAAYLGGWAVASVLPLQQETPQ